MLLLSAVGIGLMVGLGTAKWKGRPYYLPGLRFFWLAVAAFLPQLLMTFLKRTQVTLSDEIYGSTLVASLLMFLVFIWLNHRLPGMPILLAGLILNIAVIVSNGGLMPISPQVASHLVGSEVLTTMELGDRFGEKDVLVMEQDTRLELLSDRFMFPNWSPYKVAFSLGDVLIGVGAFWFLVADHRKH